MNNCVVIPETETYIGMVNKIKDYVTYGTISKEIHEVMIRALGFVHEGISRKAVYKNGEYLDIYNHAMTSQDYKSNDEKI